jgi:glycosyltransferase involved in cell wall biosynthesis
MTRKETVVALDARLYAGTSTGDSTYWTELIRAMIPEPEGLRLLLFSNVPAPAEIPEPVRRRWVHVGGSGRLWSLVGFPLAARRLGAHVIHTQYALSPLVTRGGISTIHDVSFLIGPEWFKPRDRALLRASIPGTCRRASQIITVSQTSRDEIERLVPTAQGKVRVTPLACPEWITRVPQEAAQARVRELGIEGPYALSVSTRWPRKNMDLAVRAVEQTRSGLGLVLTGKQGWGPSALGGRTRAVGYVDTETLSALYSAAALYVCPSLHEGFSIPILEAFRSGAPVVAGRGGAVPETAGRAAEIVEGWEPAAWAEAIDALLAAPGKLDALRAAGFEREREFSWERTAAQTLAVYRDVAP